MAHAFDAKKQYKHDWYERHKEQAAAQGRLRWTRNKVALSKKNKEWQAANRVKMRVYRENWRVRKRRLNMARIELIKLARGCCDCEERDPRVLDFDHRNPQDKKAAVSHMVQVGTGWAVVRAEIEKCDIRCANCHRRRTHTEKHYLTVRQ